jgi:hypothetical protein
MLIPYKYVHAGVCWNPNSQTSHNSVLGRLRISCLKKCRKAASSTYGILCTI